jgi:hypothetical protein
MQWQVMQKEQLVIPDRTSLIQTQMNQIIFFSNYNKEKREN